jgi:hypothetical protein
MVRCVGVLPKEWADGRFNGTEPSDSTSRVGLWPGNPQLCGPVWPARGVPAPQEGPPDDPGLDILAFMFKRDIEQELLQEDDGESSGGNVTD